LVKEILDLTDPQEVRYLKAYDICKRILRDLRISPSQEEAGTFEEPDEMDTGYPGMKLAHMVDVVRVCAKFAAREKEHVYFTTPEFMQQTTRIVEIIGREQLDFPSSWRALSGRLARLHRLNIFDNPRAPRLDFQTLIEPGHVSIVDLGDTDSPQLNNLVIAELLRGVALQQNRGYSLAMKEGTPPARTMVIIEEAHEFLSAERMAQMPILYQQVARISRRGRKRWLGLVFVTQLPQHLPDEVLGLINNYVLHKIADAGVISKLKRSLGGVDEGQWKRLPSLAPGQAIVSMSSMARPLMVAIDPTPCRLRLVE
jgi:hypothetical protein